MTAADAAVCQHCGHPQQAHHASEGCLFKQNRPLWINHGRCTCPAFVADVNRPDDDVEAWYDVPGDAVYPVAPLIPAVPDREGTTEQLAALIAAHGWRDNYDDGEFTGYICACRHPDSGPMDTDLARHVAAVIVAAGWTKP